MLGCTRVALRGHHFSSLSLSYLISLVSLFSSLLSPLYLTFSFSLYYIAFSEISMQSFLQTLTPSSEEIVVTKKCEKGEEREEREDENLWASFLNSDAEFNNNIVADNVMVISSFVRSSLLSFLFSLLSSLSHLSFLLSSLSHLSPVLFHLFIPLFSLTSLISFLLIFFPFPLYLLSHSFCN